MYTEQMYENSLCHYGIKGQSWGTRRYQNKDGTYTPLGERRRLEELARTGNKVTTTSALADRQQAARTGNLVRVNSASSSRPYGRPTTTTTGTSTVKVNKTNSVGTGKAQLSSANPTLKNTAKKSTLANSPSAKIVTTEEAEEKKAKRIRTSSADEDTEETKKTKKTSTKKKKTKAQQQAEQKAKEQEQQNQEEEKKDETQNEGGQLTEEQVQDYARRVIRGEFGNGQERKDKLGENYAQIQALVNAMLKGKKK